MSIFPCAYPLHNLSQVHIVHRQFTQPRSLYLQGRLPNKLASKPFSGRRYIIHTGAESPSRPQDSSLIWADFFVLTCRRIITQNIRVFRTLSTLERIVRFTAPKDKHGVLHEKKNERNLSTRNTHINNYIR